MNSGAPEGTPPQIFKIGRAAKRKERAQAHLRGEIPPWTRECLPKLYHNTPEGNREAREKKREAYFNRPLVPAAVVPPDTSDPRAERQRLMRKEYVERGLERNYPLLEDPHDRRIFKTPAPLEGFLHIARKYMTPEELEEARRPKYYGDIRYKQGAAANPTASPSPAPKPEERAVTPEPAPSTAAPAAADTSSDDEDELQVSASDDELTGM